MKRIKCVGIFCTSNVSVSESFIRDNIATLNQLGYKCHYISGKRVGEINIDLDSKLLNGFSQNRENLSFLLQKLGNLRSLKLGFQWKMKCQLFFAKRALNKISENYQIAVIEYLNTAVLTREYLEQRQIPFVVHLHGYDITAAMNDPAYKMESLKVFNSAKSIVVASDYVRRIAILNGCDAQKINVIKLPIAADNFTPISWSQRLQTTPSVAFLGRLTPKKNPIALIHAFHLVAQAKPEVRFSIIGDGPLRSEVEKLVTKLNLTNNIRIYGALPQDEAMAILNQHWIFAQHSVTASNGDQEGYALSLAEAALLELPVVSTIHNGITEHVLDGKTGFLVPEFNFELMASKILHLINHPELCQEFGKNGRENILQIHNSSVRASQLENLILGVIQ